MIREALSELPLEYREVLVLRKLEELSYRARKRLQQSFLDLAAGRNPDLQPSIALDGGVAT